jgi:hypothetical protein
LPIGDLVVEKVSDQDLDVSFVVGGKWPGSFANGTPDFYYTSAYDKSADLNVVGNPSSGKNQWKVASVISEEYIPDPDLPNDKPGIAHFHIQPATGDAFSTGFLMIFAKGDATNPTYGQEQFQEQSIVGAPYPTVGVPIKTGPGTQVPITLHLPGLRTGDATPNVNTSYFVNVSFEGWATNNPDVTYQIDQTPALYTIDWKQDPIPGAAWKAVHKNGLDLLSLDPHSGHTPVDISFNRYDQTYMLILVRSWTQVDRKAQWYDEWSGVIRRLNQ